MIQGKLRRIIIAQACRTADRLNENKACNAFELAIMEAVSRKVNEESKAKARSRYADMSSLGDASHPVNALGGLA